MSWMLTCFCFVGFSDLIIPLCILSVFYTHLRILVTPEYVDSFHYYSFNNKPAKKVP